MGLGSNLKLQSGFAKIPLPYGTRGFMNTGVRAGRPQVVLYAIGFFLLILNFGARFAAAQDLTFEGQSRASLAPPVFSATPSKKSELKLNLDQQQYATDGQTEFQRRQYTNVGIDVDLKTQGKGLGGAFHGIYQGTLQSSEEQYYGIPEAYFGEAQSDAMGIRWTVGRQKRHWSHFDEEFGMGIWQPQLRWDYLNPIQQGLTGLFFDFAPTRSVSLSFFASSLFLPDQGPNFHMRDGQFASSNRWFWSPRLTAHIFNQTPPVSYSVDMPPLSDVVFQPSLGGQLRFESRSTPWWGQVAYAYKPMNQLHLGYECNKCVGLGNLGPTATIHPSVLMHRVATAEVGLQDENQRGWVSVTSDVPTSPKGPQEWAQSSYSDVVFAGASYAHFMSLLNRPGWLKVSYLRSFETQKTQPQNSLLEGTVESSLDRFPYKEIVAAEWEWVLKQTAKNQLNWRTRYTYSIPERGSWISSQLWLRQQNWSWNLSLDILGSQVDPNSSNEGLFTRYRENDRFTGGVSYVF